MDYKGYQQVQGEDGGLVYSSNATTAGGVSREDGARFGTWPLLAPARPAKAEQANMPLLAAGKVVDMPVEREGSGSPPDTLEGDLPSADASSKEYVKYFQEPHDKYQMAYTSFVLMGMGLLFPWNTVISAVDFWDTVYGADAKMEYWISTTYMTTNILGLVLIVFFGSRFSFRSRIVPGFTMYLICMAILPAIRSQAGSLVLSSSLGAVDAVVQGSLFALVGMFSGRYVAAMMAGQGIAGMAVAVLRIISKLAVSQDPEGIEMSTYVFFGLSCFVILVCVILYLLILERSPVTKYYLDTPGRARDAAFEKMLNDSNPNKYATLPVRVDPTQLQAYMAETDASNNPVSNIAIIKQIWPMALTAALTFYVTLSLFPGVTSGLTSNDDYLNTTKWYSVIMISLFDFGDMVGRFMPNWPQLIFLNERGVLIASVLRVVFFPLFILCAKHMVFHNDAWHYVIMTLFAVSNGYVGTLCMMYGPERVKPHEKEQAGTIMVFFLTAGLVAGVWSGMGIAAIFNLG